MLHRSLLAVSLLSSVLAGCFPAAPATAPANPGQMPPSADGRAGPDDATLAAEAAGAAGGTDVTGAVTGLASMSGFVFDVAAGTCYDIAVASNDAVSTQLLVNPNDTAIYPTTWGNTAQGRIVTYAHCTDAAGRVSLQLTAHQLVRPGEMTQLTWGASLSASGVATFSSQSSSTRTTCGTVTAISVDFQENKTRPARSASQTRRVREAQNGHIGTSRRARAAPPNGDAMERAPTQESQRHATP